MDRVAYTLGQMLWPDDWAFDGRAIFADGLFQVGWRFCAFFFANQCSPLSIYWRTWFEHGYSRTYLTLASNLNGFSTKSLSLSVLELIKLIS